VGFENLVGEVVGLTFRATKY